MGMAKIRMTRSTNIFKKMMTIMSLVLFLQILVVGFFVLKKDGIIDQLKQNAANIMYETVDRRKGVLEHEMRSWKQDVQQLSYEVNEIIQERVARLETVKEEEFLSEQVMEDLMAQIINGLSNNKVSGMYMILGTADALEHRGEDQSFPGISLIRSEEGDFQLEYGPEYLTQNDAVRKMEGWQERCFLQGDEDNRFYYEPFKAAIEDPKKRGYDLGYWYSPYNEDSMFSYTIPLISKNNRVYGVVGIKVTGQQIQEILPYEELDSRENGVYLLAQSSGGDELSFRSMVKSEKGETGFLSASNLFSVQQIKGISRVYSLTEPDNPSEKWACAYETLRLYEESSPFFDMEWAIVGLVPREDLLEFVKATQQLLLSSALGAFLIGVIGSLAAIRSTTRQITNLAKKLSIDNYRQPIRLGRTHIEEIDRLAEEIEYLSDNVAESASRLQKIMSIADVGIAAFEYDRNSDTAHFMGNLSDVLRISPSDAETMTAQKLKKTIQEWYETDYSWQENGQRIFRMSHKKENYWLSMKLLEEKERIIGVFTDISKEMEERKKLEYERDYDVLTTLMNRRAFSERIKKKFEHPSEMKIAALMMMDLDNLKYINDSYGHDWGDCYLKNMAECLKHIEWDKKIVARLSGDEFTLLLYGADNQDELRHELDKLYAYMDQFKMKLPDGETVAIRASGGVSWYPLNSTNDAVLMRYADFAMYQVKNTQKGRYQEFDKEQYEHDSYLLEGGKELNRFLEERKVEYHFQPIVSAKDGSVFGYEAFIRPKTGVLKTPNELLSVARIQSKLYQIEKMTWFEVMQSYEESRDTIGNAKIFVNSIPSQVLSDRDKYQFEQRYGYLLSNMVMEMTYREKEDIQTNIDRSSWLKKYQVQTALDGFGSSYNNEKLLLHLSPDYVKIDKELIHNIDRDSNRQMMVGNIIAYAKKNNIKVIAEGIESGEEMKTAICLGADYLQGYYLGIPSKTPTKIALSVTELIRNVNCEKGC